MTPAESKKIYPLLNADNFYASLYSPQDGTIDPNGFCTALARGATNAGAKVFENVAVNDIETKQGMLGSTEVTSVITDCGTIKTKCVVNCSGAWGGNIAAMVGLKIPLIAMKHAYVTTDRIEGVENKPNLRDHDASVYIKLQGDALHIGGYEVDPIILKDGVDKEFAFGLYELDWDVFGVHIDGAIKLLPVIGETGIKSTVCGPESFTPDHKVKFGKQIKRRI
jgi:sarcosine dehydrogenase